jgi:hypothetical protein
MAYAPIALFVYNRPQHTRRTLQALRRCQGASQSALYVFSDGPRTPQAEAAVREVRELVNAIDGFASVEVNERETNLGLAKSIIDGVGQLCDAFGRVIVVEDDLVVAPGFLTYLNVALGHYENEPQVMQVAGHMFPVDVPVEEDAFFLPFVSSWGWATWARAWQEFDADASGYQELKANAARRKEFDMDGAYEYFSMLENQLAGKIDSWAILWNLSVFMNAGMVLYPKRTLVENAGFDGSGVHTRGKPLDQMIDARFLPTRFPLPRIDQAARDRVFDYFRSRRTSAAKLRALTRRVFQ